MHLLWRRHARSGSAPPWFHWLLGAGFAALAIFALVRQEWLVAALALAMIGVTAGGSIMMRRIAGGGGTPARRTDKAEDEHER